MQSPVIESAVRRGWTVTGQGDRLAIALSGLCLVHCLAGLVLLASVAGAGSALGAVVLNPMVHKLGMAAAMLLAGTVLLRGVARHGVRVPLVPGLAGLALLALALTIGHGVGELLLTMAGAALVAAAHALSLRARHRRRG